MKTGNFELYLDDVDVVDMTDEIILLSMQAGKEEVLAFHESQTKMTVNLTYNAQLDIKPWGIKSIGFNIVRILLKLQDEEKSHTLLITPSTKEWDIDNRLEISSGGEVYPCIATINFKEKQIVIC